MSPQSGSLQLLETIPAELESTTLGKQSTKADVTTIRQSTSTAIIHEGTTLDQASSNLCPDGKWTNWFNTNNPDSMGDYESHGMIRATYDVCINPVSIECRAVGSESPYDQTSGQGRITCEPNVGLLCFNEHQQSKQCPDYEVRFFCPCVDTVVASEMAVAKKTTVPQSTVAGTIVQRPELKTEVKQTTNADTTTLAQSTSVVTITAPPEVTTVGKQTTKPELTTILQSNEFDPLRSTSSTGMSGEVETKYINPSVGSTTEDLQSTIRKITIPDSLRPTSSTGMSDVVETKSVSPSVGSTTEDLQSTIRKITIPGVLFELF
ncbi:uncharacterized protein LOC102804954 [Saccoglossus kowalevskii]